MTKTFRARSAAAVAALSGALFLGGCASLGLGSVVQPPTFTTVEGRDAELRLSPPSADRPLGGATIRLWARVQNPNSFGLTLATLAGNLFLENERAAAVNFPLGLPLQARGDAVIPIELNISFSDVPGMVNVAQRILTQNRVGYRLDGTLSVDAGPLGQPAFGPSTWLRGESRVLR
jgi:hypothetical protein